MHFALSFALPRSEAHRVPSQFLPLDFLLIQRPLLPTMIHRKLPWEMLAGLWPYHTREACTRTPLVRARRCLSTASVSPIKILALESSADDTCAAIVDSDRNIHANVVMKQDDLLGMSIRIHFMLSTLVFRLTATYNNFSKIRRYPPLPCYFATSK